MWDYWRDMFSAKKHNCLVNLASYHLLLIFKTKWTSISRKVTYMHSAFATSPKESVVCDMLVKAFLLLKKWSETL